MHTGADIESQSKRGMTRYLINSLERIEIPFPLVQNKTFRLVNTRLSPSRHQFPAAPLPILSLGPNLTPSCANGKHHQHQQQRVRESKCEIISLGESGEIAMSDLLMSEAAAARHMQRPTKVSRFVCAHRFTFMTGGYGWKLMKVHVERIQSQIFAAVALEAKHFNAHIRSQPSKPTRTPLYTCLPFEFLCSSCHQIFE
jgi:hypothetical protein